MLVVTNQHNNKKVTVRVNDRGPFVAARIIDVSRAAAEQLDMIVTGTAPVLVESVDRMAVSSPSADQGRTSQSVPEAPVIAAAPTVTAAPPAYVQASTVTSSANVTEPADVFIQQPAAVHVSNQIRLTPEINIAQNKTYRLQVGSYKVARNAVDAFERLKNAGLNPAYERFTDSGNGEYFRVVLAGVRGTDVQLTAEKLGSAGFREALIREER
jgi:rare lipoprotein A